VLVSVHWWWLVATDGCKLAATCCREQLVMQWWFVLAHQCIGGNEQIACRLKDRTC
jgi:hypothetical protein